jgi:hypothetical protein
MLGPAALSSCSNFWKHLHGHADHYLNVVNSTFYPHVHTETKRFVVINSSIVFMGMGVAKKVPVGRDAARWPTKESR